MALYKVLKGNLTKFENGDVALFGVGTEISLEKENAKYLLADGDIEFISDEPTDSKIQEKKQNNLKN